MGNGYISQVATATQLIGAVGADSLSVSLYGTGVTLGIAVLFLGIGFAWSRLKKKGVGAKKF